MLKQEVIIIAGAFQQIIHIYNEQGNVDELGVTVKSLSQLLSWRERANLVVRTERFFRMLRTSSLNASMRKPHLQFAFVATAPAFEAVQERV